MHTSALVLFSGGQDSTTCLAHALSRYERVETLAFDYGQRHKVELDARLNVLAAIKARFPQWAPKLGEDHLLDAGILGQISETSLTRDTAIEMESSGLPNTFVPGRNLLFLTLAAALAYRRGLQVIVTGVCETDFSGYPDCRDDTMKAMQVALSLGMDRKLLIETPLMWLTKAETWGLAQALSRALGKLLGGGLLDLARWLQPGDAVYVSYAAVLLVEAAIAVLSLVLLARLNLRQFREDTGRSLDRVLAAELG